MVAAGKNGHLPGIGEVEALVRLFPETAGPKVRGDIPCGDPSVNIFSTPSTLLGALQKRREDLAVGLNHLHQVHRNLASHARQRGKPPALDKVLDSHLSGNSFAEEERGSPVRKTSRAAKPR